ncbi:viral A-type inclusion protein [Rhizoctonia solani]|uniref:Viral A-type inclusion protein n=1 Tax=Rhizoctonia solani TaxID=456999 RepID=A0A0K6G4L8_9AGAM|nr:viral A-type inclusion protein [Rhizoctonia solani]
MLVLAGHVSCKSCLDSMIAADRGGSGSARLHVDLGAVPSEVASSDGSETINGDAEDEARSLAREADRLATAVANAVFEQNEDKIKSTSETGQQWIRTQSQVQRTARFPVLRALSQLAVGNMQNYHACQQLEQKLLDSRANVAQLVERLQTLADVDQRDRQNFEKVRALEQERDDLRVTLTTMERSLRTTTSSLADATASLAESDTALAAAKVELEARESIRTELETVKAELEAAQTARDEYRTSLSKTKKELSSTKHELKQLRADQDHAAPHTLKDNAPAADTSGSMPEKLARRRSRKISHSAPKMATGEDGTVGQKKLDGSRSKKSRHAANGDQTEDERERKEPVDHTTDDPSKAGEHSKSKGHSKDKDRKERSKHRGKDHGDGKPKDKGDDDQPPPDSELACDGQPGVSDSKPAGEKSHKSGKSRKKSHTAQVDSLHPLERSASAPPGTEAETLEGLKVSTDSLPHSKAGSSKSPDPVSPPAGSGSASKNTSPPTTAPRRGLVETLTKGRDGLLRRAMGRKQPSNTTNDLGSASTVVNMKPAPGASPSGSSSSGPTSSTSPAVDPTAMQGSSEQLPVPQTGLYSINPLPSVENIAGIGIPGVVHEMSHGQSFGPYPASSPHSTVRSRGQTTSVPRTSEDRGSDGYDRESTWPYEPWDQSRRGKGRDREDRHERKRSGHRRHFSNEWHGEESVAPVRHYVAADDVPGMSRHGFGDIPYGESPPSYPPLYEQLMDALPRKSSFANLRGMK